jgi:hypothetical protein
MQEIVIKGIKQLYVAKYEDVPMTFDHHGTTLTTWWWPDFMPAYIRASKDVRAVVTPSISTAEAFLNKAFVHYVYWYRQDVDLDQLDTRIALNKVRNIDAYFENTVVLHYQITRCYRCNRRFHTLTMPGVTTYTADPSELNWGPVTSYRAPVLNCPRCRKPFRKAVIKTMGEYIEDPNLGLPTPPLSEDSAQTQNLSDVDDTDFKDAFDKFFQDLDSKDSD